MGKNKLQTIISPIIRIRNLTPAIIPFVFYSELLNGNQRVQTRPFGLPKQAIRDPRPIPLPRMHHLVHGSVRSRKDHRLLRSGTVSGLQRHSGLRSGWRQHQDWTQQELGIFSGRQRGEHSQGGRGRKAICWLRGRRSLLICVAI